jgi:hypothetical protein
MAWTYSVNNTPATGADAWIIIVSTLTSAGWTIPQWSDGSTVHTTGSPVAANLKNLNSWVRMQQPAINGQTREFVVQNGKATTSYSQWAVKYSARATFTNYAGSSVNAPSATDEVNWTNEFGGTAGILGNSSSTTGNFTGTFNGATDGSFRLHMAAGDASQNYSFYWVCSTNTTTNMLGGMMLDVPNAWAGSSDLDPACIYGYTSGGNTFTPAQINNNNTYGHTGQILNSTTSVASISFQELVASCPNLRALPVNSWSGNVPLLVPLWIAYYQSNSLRAAAVRGWSKTLIWDLGSAARTNYDLFTVSATGDHIWINGSLLPWPSGTAVTL